MPQGVRKIPQSPLNNDALGLQYLVVADDRSPDVVNFSTGSQSASMVIRQRRNQLGSIAKNIIGYAVADTSINAAQQQVAHLVRYLPWRHPLFPWLWASDCTLQFRGTAHQNASGFGFEPVYTIGDDHPLELRVTFTPRTYNVLSETDVGFSQANNYAGSEFKRFVTTIENPRVEFITPQGGNFQFQFADPITTIIFGQSAPINQATPVRLAKKELKWIWHDVPHSAIYSGSIGEEKLADHIIEGVGKINNAEFAGYPAGTLLMQPPRITPKSPPIQPTDLGRPTIDYAPIAYDVEYTVLHFDPPYDPQSRTFPAGLPDAPTRGWNLFPNAVSASDAWYLATRSGTIQGDRLYADYNYDLFFEPLT